MKRNEPERDGLQSPAEDVGHRSAAHTPAGQSSRLKCS